MRLPALPERVTDLLDRIGRPIERSIEKLLTGTTAEERASEIATVALALIDARNERAAQRLADALAADGPAYDRAYDAAYEAALARGLAYADAHDEAARLADAAQEATPDDHEQHARAADGIPVTRLPACAEPGCNRPATWQNGCTWKHYCSRHWDDRGLFKWERWPLVLQQAPEGDAQADPA